MVYATTRKIVEEMRIFLSHQSGCLGGGVLYFLVQCVQHVSQEAVNDPIIKYNII